ncbi:MAG: multicopper oxidase domain-containing protein [Chitinophagaceae bacterium]
MKKGETKMKKLIIVISILTSVLSVYAQPDRKDMPMQKNEASAVTYTCPMHPEIHSGKPGNCPKCGMKLIQEKPKKIMDTPALKDTARHQHDMGGMKMDNIPKTKEEATYTCPMHPEIHSGKPANCPKCGMKLVKEKSTPQPATEMDMHMHTDSIKHPHNMAGMSMTDLPKTTDAFTKTIQHNQPPKVVHYDLYITDTLVNFTGKTKRAIAVNGQLPMPTLTFYEGDTAEIYVHNELNEGTTLHWHGLILPNQYDGVPNLTQMPIMPHTTHMYRFPIVQHGTHWYHSHSGLQEQIGMYGSMILKSRKELDIPTVPIILSEWIDMKPEEVDRSLHNATDWFAIQKGTTQSYSEAIKSGHLKTKLTNEWKRMNAMDVSDVAYDKFLINGISESQQPQFKAGDKVRLRIANGGASSYFWLTYAGGKITVIASDGNDVEPVEVDRLLIAVSETYDVIVTIPANKQYEFLATPEDRTKSASLWLGSGEKIAASRLPKLKYFAGMKMMNEMMAMDGNLLPMEGMEMRNQTMDMNQVMYPEITGEAPSGKQEKVEEMKNIQPDKSDSMKGMDMDQPKKDNTTGHDMHRMQMPNSNSMAGMNMGTEEMDIVTLNYAMLKAPENTTLREGPLKELKFDLTGNMNRYVWSMDNKVISEADKILVKKGENLRIILYNNSMMRHPMHLHGHDFRLLNGQGDYAPLKNVIDIMPMERDTIEFAATESGDWFFHCHILYHMMSGMGRVVSYENSPANPEIPDPKLAQRRLFADDRMPHLMAKLGIETNGSDGMAMLANTRWKLNTMWHLGYHDMHGYESETILGRYIGKMQWLYPYIGFDYHYKVAGGPKNIFGPEDKNWFGQSSNKNQRKTAVAGIAYTLPTLTIADIRIDGDGKLRFQLSREDIALTPRLRFSWMINTDKEYSAGFRYIATKYISVSSHYDSDMGLGAGLIFTY